MRAGNRAGRDETVLQHERAGARPADHARQAPCRHGAGGRQARADHGVEQPSPRHAEAVLRVGEPDPHLRRRARDRVQARHVERGHHGPLLDPESPKRVCELVEAPLELQVDVQADRRRLLGEERQRLVERRQVGRDLPQLGERPLPHRARRPAVAHLVEVVGVGQDEGAASQVEHVELDEIDAVRDGGSKGVDGVLGRDVRRASMTDPEHASPVSSPQLDHAALLFADRSHHHASGARTIAWTTVIVAASWETSSQNRSG